MRSHCASPVYVSDFWEFSVYERQYEADHPVHYSHLIASKHAHHTHNPIKIVELQRLHLCTEQM
jgi:hypothetical protein